MAYLAFPTTNYGDDLGLLSAPGGRGESGVRERPGLWTQNEFQLLPREEIGALCFLGAGKLKKLLEANQMPSMRFRFPFKLTAFEDPCQRQSPRN